MFSAEFKASIKNGGKSLDIDLVDDHSGGQGRSGKKCIFADFEIPLLRICIANISDFLNFISSQYVLL